MFSSSGWFDSTITSVKKLKIAWNNGLRRLPNLPKYNSGSEVFVNLNIPSFFVSCCENLYFVLRP